MNGPSGPYGSVMNGAATGGLGAGSVSSASSLLRPGGRLDFAPAPAKTIRLVLDSTEQISWWSIDEINARCVAAR